MHVTVRFSSGSIPLSILISWRLVPRVHSTAACAACGTNNSKLKTNKLLIFKNFMCLSLFTNLKDASNDVI